MSDRALYFPYINVPQSSWLTRVLLYWDGLGSIVPSEYRHTPERLAPHMRELVMSGLVEQIFPGPHVFQVPNFTEAFISYIDSRIPKHQLRQQRGAQPWVRIHIEKLGDVAHELVRLRLARPLDYPWYDTEPWVARSFMAYLTSVLGRLENINADPVTNDPISFLALGGNPGIRDSRNRRATARSLILSEIFPLPGEPISIGELVLFKARYGHLAQRLRRRVESKCIEIASIGHPAIRQEQADNVARELNDEIQAIVEAMKGMWAKVIFAGLIPLLGQGLDLLPNGGLAGTLSLLGAVYSALDAARERRALLESPVAYAALFQRRLIPRGHDN